jgi:GntR family transcriptional regulator
MPPMTRIDLSSGPVALYGQLADILRAKIYAGAWPDGYEIPRLHDLSEEYSLARVTVRQAILLLVNEGLLSSHRGRRTFVTYRPPTNNPSPLFPSINIGDLEAGEYSVKIIDIEKVNGGDIPTPFKGDFRGKYVMVRKTDSLDGAPYGTSINYIRDDVFSLFPKKAPARTKLARLLRDYAGGMIEQCVEKISVKSSDQSIAIALQILEGDAIAVIHRVFLDADSQILYYGVLNYAGSRFGIERDITDKILS